MMQTSTPVTTLSGYAGLLVMTLAWLAALTGSARIIGRFLPKAGLWSLGGTILLLGIAVEVIIYRNGVTPGERAGFIVAAIVLDVAWIVAPVMAITYLRRRQPAGSYGREFLGAITGSIGALIIGLGLMVGLIAAGVRWRG